MGWKQALRGLLVLSLAGGTLGCEDSTSLLLTSVCAEDVSSFSEQVVPGCQLSGDAAFTTGLSADSTAVALGPSGGSLRIRINAMPASSETSWTLDVLAASTRPEDNVLGRSLSWGSCGAACPADPADAQAPVFEGFDWVTVIDEELGSNISPPPDDAFVVLSGADIHILDIRTPGFEELAQEPP